MMRNSTFFYIKAFTCLLLLTASMIFTSCSNLSSGHYVKLTKSEDIQSLAKQYQVEKWKLEEHNKGTKFVAGEWVFIPLPHGVLEQVRNPANPGGLMSPEEFIWPVPSSTRISSYFGNRFGRKHLGIDIPGRRGTHILASANGTVVYVGKGYSGFGNMIVLAHKKGYFSIYAHNKKNHVEMGEIIHQGQVIAELGNTGRSTGPHCHFEIRKNSEALDPVAFIRPESKSQLASLFTEDQ